MKLLRWSCAAWVVLAGVACGGGANEEEGLGEVAVSEEPLGLGRVDERSPYVNIGRAFWGNQPDKPGGLSLDQLRRSDWSNVELEISSDAPRRLTVQIVEVRAPGQERVISTVEVPRGDGPGPWTQVGGLPRTRQPRFDITEAVRSAIVEGGRSLFEYRLRVPGWTEPKLPVASLAVVKFGAPCRSYVSSRVQTARSLSLARRHVGPSGARLFYAAKRAIFERRRQADGSWGPEREVLRVAGAFWDDFEVWERADGQELKVLVSAELSGRTDDGTVGWVLATLSGGAWRQEVFDATRGMPLGFDSAGNVFLSHYGVVGGEGRPLFSRRAAGGAWMDGPPATKGNLVVNFVPWPSGAALVHQDGATTRLWSVGAGEAGQITQAPFPVPIDSLLPARAAGEGRVAVSRFVGLGESELGFVDTKTGDVDWFAQGAFGAMRVVAYATSDTIVTGVGQILHRGGDGRWRAMSTGRLSPAVALGGRTVWLTTIDAQPAGDAVVVSRCEL